MARDVFEESKQYHLERADFVEIFREVWEEIIDVYDYEGWDFKIWYHEDEWYVLYKPSGILVNWYKNLGRINTCNKDLTKEELKQFVKLLKEELKKTKKTV
jgi:hypothetical protein